MGGFWGNQIWKILNNTHSSNVKPGISGPEFFLVLCVVLVLSGNYLHYILNFKLDLFHKKIRSPRTRILIEKGWENRAIGKKNKAIGKFQGHLTSLSCYIGPFENITQKTYWTSLSPQTLMLFLLFFFPLLPQPSPYWGKKL